MIEIKNLIYDYPGHRALHNISLSIKKGSITALVGPNGAGKTTLLKCVSALTKPLSGSIKIDGIDVFEDPIECHRKIGFLIDLFGLYENLTVKQALSYFAAAYKMNASVIDERISFVLESVGLSDKLQNRIGTLSRGMKQRLAIAQTMIHNPQILLLDEPASGLDPEARHALGELFLKLNSEGITIVVSSHILSELDQYASDLLIMREGKIVDHTISVKEQKEKHPIDIYLSSGVEDACQILDSDINVESHKRNGENISLIFTGSDFEQTLLLKNLVEAGIEVKEFFIKKENLQEQYLERVKQT